MVMVAVAAPHGWARMWTTLQQKIIVCIKSFLIAWVCDTRHNISTEYLSQWWVVILELERSEASFPQRSSNTKPVNQ